MPKRTLLIVVMNEETPPFIVSLSDSSKEE